ncbi:TRAP transporter substrate-binding protein [Roseospirillum parvum]|uniref:TRAP-type C4-dicarboxylate transport system, substrate-binding protein n=1 Tax=Roseospirillum parvum TaxID=83401 RepID=A0A1G7ZAZ9_9PROT|nr:TRAP transporter substrate-binding protein [Roseospirillum parvum]SDH05923.1 TRAP-type C4-dicarboxylate transport system, substrate-binding protein [Roseospirillum parvum]
MVHPPVRLLAGLLFAVTLLLGPLAAGPARAAEVTLRFSHFWPAVTGMHKEMFQVWADSVQTASQGRIEVEIYPSSTLAKAPAQYDAVIDRIADMTATVQGYTAGRFPLSQVVELPGLVHTAAQGSCILQALYDEGLVADEYAETHPLFLFTHGPGHIHTRDTVIRAPEDFAGLRIRRPTLVVASLLEGLGAQPVAMPAPQSFQAMERGVIDGVALPWEAMESFRLNELAGSHTEVGGLYSLAFMVTMNKDVYAALPDDLKAVIDAHSGADWSARAAAVFDRRDIAGRATAEKAGHTIVTIDGAANDPAWKPVLEGTTEGYLAHLEADGKPARAVHARALELAAGRCQ